MEIYSLFWTKVLKMTNLVRVNQNVNFRYDRVAYCANLTLTLDTLQALTSSITRFYFNHFPSSHQISDDILYYVILPCVQYPTCRAL